MALVYVRVFLFLSSDMVQATISQKRGKGTPSSRRRVLRAVCMYCTASVCITYHNMGTACIETSQLEQSPCGSCTDCARLVQLLFVRCASAGEAGNSAHMQQGLISGRSASHSFKHAYVGNFSQSFPRRLSSYKVHQFPPGYCATLLYPVSGAYRPCAGICLLFPPTTPWYSTSYLIIVLVSSRHPSRNPLPSSFILEAHKHDTYIELGSGAGFGTSAALTMR
jgi:hypothetical protein